MAGWRCANGGIFLQQGDWFIDVLPSLLWKRGVMARLSAKPMKVDPVFWSIVGLPENGTLPLSFRANGAWVLRPPFSEAFIALNEPEPELLACALVKWATDRLPEVAALSIDNLLGTLEETGDRDVKNFAALEICLHLMRDDYESAINVCQSLGPH